MKRMKNLVWLVLAASCCRLEAQIFSQEFSFGATTNTPGASLALLAFNDTDASNFVADTGFCLATVSGAYFDYNIGSDPGSYTFPYAGYFYDAKQTFGAVAATPANGGPVPGAAAPGTVIGLKLLGIAGPAGATFAFWDINPDSSYGTNLTWSASVPFSGGTNLIRISQDDRDPFGYVQNQVFGFTKPGLYRLTWQAVDLSTNGPGGGPVDQPSAPFVLAYQADCTISGVSVQADGAHLEYAAPYAEFINASGYPTPLQYNILHTSSLGANANWSLVTDGHGNPVTVLGDDYMHTNIIPASADSQFFRLYATPAPVPN